MHFKKALIVLPLFSTSLQAEDYTHLGRVGLYDQGGGNEFMRSDGFRSSVVEGLTRSGFVRGASNRYRGSQSSFGQAAWVGNASGVSVRLGFYNTTEFTGFNFAESATTGMNEAGYTIGYSTRYQGTSSNLGQAAWVAAPDGTTRRIGFFDAGGSGPYTSNLGVQLSTASGITPSGHISGTSQRFAGATLLGEAAWVANTAGNTTRIGFFSGAEYTQTNGFQKSEVAQTADTGFILGRSNRFFGNALNGSAAWIASPNGTTNRVGLYNQGQDYTGLNQSQECKVFRIIDSGHATGTTDRKAAGISGKAAWVAASNGLTQRVGLWTGSVSTEFTSSNGIQNSDPLQMVQTGYVIGTSDRYNGVLASRGKAAWLANTSGQTLRLGFYDQSGGNDHTQFNGYQETEVKFLAESGRTAGNSYRFLGTALDMGRTAWTANHTGSHTRLGFFDSLNYTKSGGYQWSEVLAMSETGHCVGFSKLYEGSADRGEAAWVSLGSGAPTRLGYISGDEFRKSGGARFSRPKGVTASGLVHGYSERYNNGTTLLGQVTWVATTAGVMQQTGIYDAMHTRSTGERWNETEFLTEQGLAAGHARRYNGLFNQVGQTAWIFNRTTGVLQKFELSSRTDNGRGFSQIHGITPDGLAYGTFEKYNGNALVGTFAFIWSRATGTVKFDGSAPSQLPPLGWNTMESIDFAVEGGYFASTGRPATAAGGQGIALWTVAGFANWDALDSLPVDQRDPDDTPAGDGVANLVKYALGVLPLHSATERLPRMGAAHAQNGQIYPVASFVHSLNAPRVDIVVQVANSLDYANDLGHTVLSRETPGDGTERVTVRSNASYSQQSRQFFRLKINGL